MIFCIFMTENEDKLLHNILKRKLFYLNFYVFGNMYLKLLVYLKKLLEALLLEHIGLIQYEIYF